METDREIPVDPGPEDNGPAASRGSDPTALSPTPASRGPMIAALAIVATLVLVVAIGGSILAYRALSPVPDDPSPATPTGASAAADELVLGDVTVRGTGAERGVRRVGGNGSAGIEPEGEYVVITYEVINDGADAVAITGKESLETADGEVHPAAQDAARAHLGESLSFGYVQPGEQGDFHAVHDVPIGSEPTGLRIDLSTDPDSGQGVLPVTG